MQASVEVMMGFLFVSFQIVCVISYISIRYGIVVY